MLHELFYVSLATGEMSKDDLNELLLQAREKNERLNITGLLIYYKGKFMQILEGEKDAIFELYETICNDKRNHLNMLCWDHGIQERGFTGWSMAFKNLDDEESSKMAGFSDFLEDGFTSELSSQNQSAAQQLLAMFKNEL